MPATDLLDPPPTPFVFNYENLSFETPSLYGPTRPKPNSRRKKKRRMRLPETDLGATVVSRRWGVLKGEKKQQPANAYFHRVGILSPRGTLRSAALESL